MWNTLKLSFNMLRFFSITISVKWQSISCYCCLNAIDYIMDYNESFERKWKRRNYKYNFDLFPCGIPLSHGLCSCLGQKGEFGAQMAIDCSDFLGWKETPKKTIMKIAQHCLFSNLVLHHYTSFNFINRLQQPCNWKYGCRKFFFKCVEKPYLL